MQPHLDPETLDGFLAGTSGAEQASAVELHIDGCEECRVLLSNLVRSRRAAVCHTTDVALAPGAPRPNDLIGGKYRVERVLGMGGMGTVVAAWHQQLNQRVALKFIRPELVADPQVVARFQREARAAARLQTTHVGRVLDLDTLPEGTPFLVMEFLEGETVEQRLAREKRIGLAQVIEWLRQWLEALSEAHALGIVHRDLKPANLFLVKKPNGGELLKVLDFGIAKSVHPEIERGLSGTSSHLMVGSPPYMAPEQLEPGKRIDARADVWAAGVVLYQLLSGQLPFESPKLVELMFSIQTRAHRPLAELVPEVPLAISQLVDCCLAKNPKQRFADAPALLLGLEEALKKPATIPRRWPRRGWPLAGALAALAAAIFLLALGTGWWRSSTGERALAQLSAPGSSGPDAAAEIPASVGPPPAPAESAPAVPLPAEPTRLTPKPAAPPARAAKRPAASDEEVFGERR